MKHKFQKISAHVILAKEDAEPGKTEKKVEKPVSLGIDKVKPKSEEKSKSVKTVKTKEATATAPGLKKKIGKSKHET